MHKAVAIKANGAHSFGFHAKYEELGNVQPFSALPDKFLSDRRH